MASKRIWGVNLLILSVLVICLVTIWQMSRAGGRGVMMNCSSELFDRSNDDDDSYLLVDLMMQEQSVQLNYRYFDTQGQELGLIAMEGVMDSQSQDNGFYTMSMHSKQESAIAAQERQPAHMKYISYVSSLNLNDSGSHKLSIEVLDKDNANDYAIVLFQPSNTVCGCRLVQ